MLIRRCGGDRIPSAVGIGFLLALIFVRFSAAGEQQRPQPLAGQIIIDPQHRAWLKHHGGKHVFICGPGDPEDFLYRGKRLADGTRKGDQEALIGKLIRHGGNCVYLQAVRSHGGDGRRDHNPFHNSDPRRGINVKILDQWERWFDVMDRNGILIYFFFYDDSSDPWRRITDDRHNVCPEERRFLHRIVRTFAHHKNLIWIVAEECEEAFSMQRVHAIAREIRRADRHGHIVGTHHQSSLRYKYWRPGCPLDHFAMQYNVPGEKAHRGAIEAFRLAKGKYQVIYAENTEAKPNAEHAWRSAMGGLMPMMLDMDIASTPAEELRRCRVLQRFFEDTDFYRTEPHDELAAGGTQYILADPGSSYIAFATRLQGSMGVRNMKAGQWRLTWVDCAAGNRIEQTVTIQGGDAAFPRPRGIGTWCAVWIRRHR